MGIVMQFDWVSLGLQLAGLCLALKLSLFFIDKMMTRNEELEKQRTENTQTLFIMLKEQSQLVQAKEESNSLLNKTLHNVIMAELETCNLRNTKMEAKVEGLQAKLDHLLAR